MRCRNLQTIHPTVRLDPTVERKNESHQHWAIKAAFVDQLRADPSYVGTIETEKKTSDLIGDIRCELSESPPDVPRRFVIEIETAASNKDRRRATTQHTRFGYDVYWVFTVAAHDARQATEHLLAKYLPTPPSLGIASLADGELSLGTPITFEEFSPPAPWMGRHELYVPTYDRSVDFFNHGDFMIDGDRMTIYRKPKGRELYTSRYLKDGQQTLPKRATSQATDILQQLKTREMKRVSPVRGPP